MNYQSVQEMFTRTAAAFAHEAAIERDGRAITYAELESHSNRLANCLRADGAAKGSMIALFTDDPVQIISGILAVLKAGAVFVPLDPAFPNQRLQVMTEQVGPRWFVTESRYLEKLARLQQHTATEARLICIDKIDNDNCKHPALASDPNAPCSIFFTSGSTGKPKAILGRLKGIDHFITWEIEAVAARPGTRVSQLASPSFDGFLKDAFVPLCSGGVACAPESRDILLDPGRLIDWIDVEQIEVLHLVPSVFRSLINHGLKSRYFEALRYVALSGEQVYPADVKHWMDVFGERIQLLNFYGPTETPLIKSCHRITAADATKSSVPVGKPMKGAAMMVIDQQGQPCSVGDAGEIYIRTPYCALGY